MRGEFVDLHGTRVYYYAAGSRGVGDPVLLIAGPPYSSATWAPLVPLLPRGHRVIVVDPLGCGRSDPPPAADASPSAHAHALCALMRSFGVPRISVVAHGTGAAITMAMLTKVPDCITRAAFVAPIVDGAFPGRTATRLSALLPDVLVAARLRHVVASGYANEAFGERAGATVVRHAFTHWRRHADAFATPTAPFTIAAPSLVIAGDEDPFVSVDTAAAFAGHIGGDFTIIAGGRHALAEEFPTQIAAHLSTFLQQ